LVPKLCFLHKMSDSKVGFFSLFVFHCLLVLKVLVFLRFLNVGLS
jgi:hypothetical protein